MTAEVKKMKKILLAVVLMFSLSLCFTACKPSIPPAEPGEKVISVYILNQNDEVVFSIKDYDTDAEYFDGVLAELKSKGKITWESVPSIYGKNTTNLCGIAVTGTNYFGFFSNDDDLSDNSGWMPNYTMDGVEYKPTNWGISSMPIKDGKTYILVYTVYTVS